jgi:transcriptional antiterminator NusG
MKPIKFSSSIDMTYWYVMRVALGAERKLEERLNNKIHEGRLPGFIRFLSPVEKEYYSVNGKKHIRDRVIYGGYLYVEAERHINKEDVEEVSTDSDVKSFLGTKGHPSLLTSSDVKRIIKDEILEKRIAEKTTTIGVGSKVKIHEGPFIGFFGEVTDLNMEKNKAKVLVKIFERESIVDLSLTQIQKHD